MFLCCSIPLVASIASPATQATEHEDTIQFVVIIASQQWIVHRGKNKARVVEKMAHDRGQEPDGMICLL